MAVLCIVWGIKGVFIIFYYIDYAGVGPSSEMSDRLNLIFNSGCFGGLLLLFLIFAGSVGYFVIRTSSERWELVTRLYRVKLFPLFLFLF